MYSIYNTHNNKQHNNQESHNDKIQVTAKYILAPFIILVLLQGFT